MTPRLWALVPVAAFAALAIVFAIGLQRDRAPGVIPSALIGRPVPDFALPPVHPDRPGLSAADLRTGEVTVVNMWASWCAPCRLEHPILMKLAQTGAVRVVGIAYKDAPEKAQAFLASLGDPFALSALDIDGRVSIDWGVYGVPETFVVDGRGVIVAKHTGPLDMQTVDEVILPAIALAKLAAPGS